MEYFFVSPLLSIDELIERLPSADTNENKNERKNITQQIHFSCVYLILKFIILN